MKKTLLLGLLALAGFSANAQIADGSEAPDFSGTNVLTQEEVSLQAYLDEGKTVVVYMSAAWCGPCWSFHNTHYLSDIYYAFGPDGSDEIAVIYIESDWRTPEGEIFGEDLPQDLPAGVPAPPVPLGDWTAGTPYPIINNDNVGADYDIPGYPTMFAICPQGVGEPGIVTEIERGTPAELTTFINGACTDLTGVENYAAVDTDDIGVCENISTTAIENVRIKNYGSNPISSGNIVIKQGGTVITTQSISEAIAPYETKSISFNDTEFDASLDYTVEVSEINGVTPFETSLNSYNLNIIPAANADNNLTVNVTTDYYPGEITWDIRDGNNNIVLEGGPYQEGPEQYGGGGPDALTLKTYYLNVPEGTQDCYTINLYDAYGDGWSAVDGSTSAGISIYNLGELIVEYRGVGDFGNQMNKNGAFKTNGQLDAEKFNTDEFSIYPNPSTGIFNFATQNIVDVTVIDVTGKTVHAQKGINNGDVMNLSQLQPGIYIAKITGDNATEKTQKLVIK